MDEAYLLEEQARTETVCRGCGGEKGTGLIVCWPCFKYRDDVVPFKYFDGTFWDWLQRVTLECADAERVRAFRRFEPCSPRASGAIICPTITCAPEKSATARAAIAATTRTPSQSLPLTGSWGDCGAEKSSHRTRASGSSRIRSHGASLCHRRAPCGRPAIIRRGKELGRWRGPPSRAHAHPPTLRGYCGRLAFVVRIELRSYGSCPLAGMLFPLIVIWNATFKEKGAAVVWMASA